MNNPEVVDVICYHFILGILWTTDIEKCQELVAKECSAFVKEVSPRDMETSAEIEKKSGL